MYLIRMRDDSVGDYDLRTTRVRVEAHFLQNWHACLMRHPKCGDFVEEIEKVKMYVQKY